MANKVDTSEFEKKLNAVIRTYKQLPAEIATIAVNFSKERFVDQAWLDVTKYKWKPRKQRRGKTARRSQTLLVDTGRLKRSIRKIKADTSQIIIGSDVPYAKIQNDGGVINKTVTVKSHTVRSHRRKAHTRTRKGRTENIKAQTIKAFTVKPHSRKMNTKIPSRRFMGNSYTLAKRIENHITVRFIKALK